MILNSEADSLYGQNSFVYFVYENSFLLHSYLKPFFQVTVEQPMFSANFIRGKITAQPNGNFMGEVKFKLVFKSGGAIEYGQAMLKAAHLGNYLIKYLH